MRYNCTIIDLSDRSVVASETGKWITSDLAIKTLEKALDSLSWSSKIVTLWLKYLIKPWGLVRIIIKCIDALSYTSEIISNNYINFYQLTLMKDTCYLICPLNLTLKIPLRYVSTNTYRGGKIKTKY